MKNESMHETANKFYILLSGIFIASLIASNLIFQKFFVLYCFVFLLSGLYHDPKNHDRKKWSNLGDQ